MIFYFLLRIFFLGRCVVFICKAFLIQGKYVSIACIDLKTTFKRLENRILIEGCQIYNYCDLHS